MALCEVIPMVCNRRPSAPRWRAFANSAHFALPLALLLSGLAYPLLAQTTIDTGSIVGTVSDPSSAVVSGAKVSTISVATGQVTDLTSNSYGAFNSGALVPGNYRTQVSAVGFATVAVPVTVLVGNTATVNACRVTSGTSSSLFVARVDCADARTDRQTPTSIGIIHLLRTRSFNLTPIGEVRCRKASIEDSLADISSTNPRESNQNGQVLGNRVTNQVHFGRREPQRFEVRQSKLARISEHFAAIRWSLC